MTRTRVLVLEDDDKRARRIEELELRSDNVTVEVVEHAFVRDTVRMRTREFGAPELVCDEWRIAPGRPMHETAHWLHTWYREHLRPVDLVPISRGMTVDQVQNAISAAVTLHRLCPPQPVPPRIVELIKGARASQQRAFALTFAMETLIRVSGKGVDPFQLYAQMYEALKGHSWDGTTLGLLVQTHSDLLLMKLREEIVKIHAPHTLDHYRAYRFCHAALIVDAAEAAMQTASYALGADYSENFVLTTAMKELRPAAKVA